jgi:dTDP-4-dehydrorhamnose 3,5-epimerase
MRFLETELDGARLIDLEPLCDNRGYFSRTFCVREFASHGPLLSEIVAGLSLIQIPQL